MIDRSEGQLGSSEGDCLSPHPGASPLAHARSHGAGMTWAPKPRDWRQYQGWYHRPTFGPTPLNHDEARKRDRAYLDWLAEARGWSAQEAEAYCDKMDRRKIIRQETAPDGPFQDAGAAAFRKLASEGKRAQRAHVAETQAANRERWAKPEPVAIVEPVVEAPLPPERDYLAEYKANAARVRRAEEVAENVVPLPAPVVRLVASSERRGYAAALLRELAGEYGPRRAHKMRAMADFLAGESAGATRQGYGD